MGLTRALAGNIPRALRVAASLDRAQVSSWWQCREVGKFRCRRCSRLRRFLGALDDARELATGEDCHVLTLGVLEVEVAVLVV